MGRSRSRSRGSRRGSSRERRRGSSRDRLLHRSRSPDRSQDKTRDRSRDRDRSKERSRQRDRSRVKRKDRSRSRDRSRDRSKDRCRDDERGRSQARPEAEPARSASADKRARLEAWKARQQQGAAAAAAAAPAAPAAAWAPWDDPSLAAGVAPAAAAAPAAAPQPRPAAPAWAPPPGFGAPPPGYAPPLKPMTGHGVAASGLGLSFAAAAKKAAAALPAEPAPSMFAADDDVDPLDAFMASAVIPQVAERQAVEAKRREDERLKYAEMIAAGKVPLAELLEDSDEEPQPDMIIMIPTNKVKLLVGAGGLTIGSIQRKSKARVQIKKTEEDLGRAWGTGSSAPVKIPPHIRKQMQQQQAAAARAAKEGRLLQGSKSMPASAPVPIQLTGVAGEGEENAAAEAAAADAPVAGGGEQAAEKEAEEESGDEEKPNAPPRKMTTVEIFGDAKAVEIAERMIHEAIDNREQKVKQRHREYERKRDEKRRARTLYHMRHTKNYEALELVPGASKIEVKKAYRRLAMLWHPDKHPTNQDEAKAKFQVIQKAYDALMSTDEEEIQMQLAS